MDNSSLNRRRFLQGLTTTAAAVATVQVQALADQVNQNLDASKGPAPQGPGAVPMKLEINGEEKSYSLEPRVTLLDALRNYGPHTGAKEGCDRATCGACSVLVDGNLVYSCMILAIEAQGRKITTIEGLAQNGELTPVQKAFVECDALMCGYCTPGFVLAATALLKSNPKPTPDQVKTACSGNLCRCGTYPHIIKAVLRASGAENVTPSTITS